MADSLFDARNALTVGSYDQAFGDASTAKCDSRKAEDVAAFNADKDAIIARAQIGLGQLEGVIAQLRTSSHPMLLAVASFAEMKLAMRTSPVPVRSNLEEDTAVPPAVQAALEKVVAATEHQEVAPQNAFFGILAGLAFLTVGDVKAAAEVAWKWIGGLPAPQGSAATRQLLELRSIVCECMLRLNRSDLALREIREMEKVDDEAITTLMYTGMVALHEARKEARSKDNYTLAVNAFKDAAMRCGNSVMLMNLQALAHMGLQQFDQAEKCLLDALSLRSGDPDTIANLAALSAHLGKSAEQSDHYLTQAASMPGAWAQYYAKAGAAFDAADSAFVAQE